MEWSPIWISLRTSATAIVFTFFLGVLCARKVAFMKSDRLRDLIDGILTLPMVLPPTVAGFILLMVFGPKRPVGILLGKIGVKLVFSWWATVLAATIIAFPLMYRAARGAFEQVDPNLIDAGRTLGISERRIFWQIVLPEALPGVLSGGILAFARALGEFGATAMIAGNISGKTRTLPLAIYGAVAGGGYDDAVGYVWILGGFSFVIMLLMNWMGKKTYRKGAQK